MSHPPNRTNLPPTKGAEEYEREITRLKAEITRLKAEVSALTPEFICEACHDTNTVCSYCDWPLTLCFCKEAIALPCGFC